MSRAAGLYCLAAASGLLQVAVFPKFSLYWLAPVAVAPLLWAVARAETPRRRFALGWLAGSIYWGGTCYWVYDVMHEYAYLPAPAAGAIFLAFFLAKGLHLGAFAWLAGRFIGKPWAAPAAAALWTAIEGSHQYLGFTWLHLGAAGASMPALARLAPWTGVYGLSFVFALMNAALALALLGRRRRELAWLLGLALIFLLPALPEGEVGDRAVRIVQPNVRPDEMIGGWSAPEWRRHQARMLELSTTEAERIDPTPPELVIWPEYSVPAYYFDSETSRKFLENVARQSRAYFVFNTLAFKQVDGERRPLNSAVTLDPEGRFVSRYAKMHLVPFGEFVPWPFSLFIDKITLAAGDFYPGEEASIAVVGGHRIGIFICYESVFPGVVRRFAADGAEALVNISNDSWYGRTSARHQHLLIARMRAIENGRWLLRATNDGLTTVINRAGQIAPPLPSFEQGVLTARFSYSSETTLFTRFGEWFWYLCLAGTALAVLRRGGPAPGAGLERSAISSWAIVWARLCFSNNRDRAAPGRVRARGLTPAALSLDQPIRSRDR